MSARPNSVLGLVVVLAGAAALYIFWRASSPPRQIIEVASLNVVLDAGPGTNNPVLSDIYVRASKALEVGDAKAAESLYREAISTDPNDSFGYASLGGCLYAQELYDEAEAEYVRALELDSDSKYALYGLGCIAFDGERHTEARDYLKKALGVDDNDGLSHRLLGMVYEELGNQSEATRHYERAIELASTIGDIDYVRDRLAALKH